MENFQMVAKTFFGFEDILEKVRGENETCSSL